MSRQRYVPGRVRDSFKDWNLLHKSVVALIAAFFVAVIYNAVTVMDGAFQFEEERVLPFSAAQIWPWVHSAERRTDWQANVIDTTAYTGDSQDVGSTRLMFWKEGYTRWHAFEQTEQVLPERLYATLQESDIDRRWLRIELDPISACETRVRISETVFPLEYEKRFWFFRRKGQEQDRLDISLSALNRWLETREGGCS